MSFPATSTLIIFPIGSPREPFSTLMIYDTVESTPKCVQLTLKMLNCAAISGFSIRRLALSVYLCAELLDLAGVNVEIVWTGSKENCFDSLCLTTFKRTYTGGQC